MVTGTVRPLEEDLTVPPVCHKGAGTFGATSLKSTSKSQNDFFDTISSSTAAAVAPVGADALKPVLLLLLSVLLSALILHFSS